MNSFVETIEKANRAKREAAQIQARDKDPDQFARSRALADEMGLEPGFVNRNFDALSGASQKNNFIRAVESSPAAKKFFENPDNAALAKDDAEKISFVEGLWNVATKRVPLGLSSRYNQALGETSFQVAADKSQSYLGIAADEFTQAPSSVVDFALGPIDEAYNVYSRSARKFISSITGYDEQAASDARTRFGNVSRIEESLKKAPIGDRARGRQKAVVDANKNHGFLAALGEVAADPIGSLELAVNIGLESAPSLVAASAATIVTRNPRVGAAVMGGSSALTERYSTAAQELQKLGYDLKKPSEFDRLLTNPEHLRKAQEMGFTKGVIVGAFDWASGGVAGKQLSQNPFLNMFYQTGVQAGLGGGGEAFGGLAAEGKIDGANVIFEMLGEAAFAVPESVGVGGQYILDQGKASKARRSHAALEQITQAVRETNLSKRDKAKAQELLSLITGDDAKVYVSSSALDILFQEDQDAGDTFLQDMGIRDQWEGARAAGADLVIPASTFLSHANDERFAEYLNHVRVDPAEMSLAEAEAFEAERETRIQEVLDDMAPPQEPDVRSQIADEVQRDLLAIGEANDVSRYQSQLVAANMVTMAERLGQDPVQYYRENRHQVYGPEPKGLKYQRDSYDAIIDRARSGNRLEMDQTPVLSFLGQYGGVKRGSNLDAELRNLGVTDETVPGLFRDESLFEDAPQGKFEKPLVSEPDEIAVGVTELFRDLPVDQNGYLDMDTLVGAIQRELSGDPIRTQDELDQLSKLDEPADALIEFLDMQGLDIAEMSNEEVKAAIERGQMSAQGVLFQTKPVVELTGSEVIQDETDLRAARDAAREWYRNNLQGTTVQTKQGQVEFRAVGRRKLGLAYPDPVKFRMVPAIVDVLQKGEWGEPRPLNKPRKDRIVRFYSVTAPVSIAGEIREAQVLVGEDDAGKLYYNLYDKTPSPEPSDGSAGGQGGSEGKALKQDIISDGDGINLTLGQSAEGPRGSYEPGPNIIRLTEHKNLSTFLHEAGHMFLFQLGKYGTRDTAPDDVRADLQTTLDWLGAPDFASLTTEQHEQWARGFEAYLREGKAPSIELQSAFARFRAWLLSIYRSLKGLNVELSDDIRGVMDRLLATEDAIEAAKSQLAISALKPEEMGLTDAEAREYQSLAQKAMEQARSDIDAKLLKEQVREGEKWWKDESAKIREEVGPIIKKAPVNRAFLAMARNQDPNGNPLPEKIKLNKAALVDAFGEDILKVLPRPYVYAAQGGIHQDIAARMFGFNSGEELVIALTNMDKVNDAIEAEVERVMKERHGDMLNDGSLQREAIEAMQNDVRASFLAVEYQALQRQGGKGAPVQAIKVAAARIVAESKVDHATQAHRYRQAEIRMARETERNLAQGNAREAMRSKGRQLLNHYLSIEAAKAQKEVDKTTSYFRKFLNRKKKWTGVDGEHIQKIRELLIAFNFGPRLSDPKRAKLEARAVYDWMQRTADDPNALYVFPEEILNAENKTHFRDLTMNELRALRDTVKSLHANGRALKKALLDEKQRQYDELVEDVVTSIEAKKPVNSSFIRTPDNPKARNPKFWDKQKAMVRTFDSALVKVEQLAIWLDGGERGPFWNAVFKPMADAQAKRFDMLKEYSVKVGEILKSAPAKQRLEWNRDRHTMPTGDVLKGSELMAMGLNWGNEDNRSRMMLGEGWAQSDIEAALDKLSKEEWDIIQQIWDTIDGLYPEINAVHKLHTDVDLPKVEALPVQTKYGEYKGGYYPIVYDRMRDPLAEKIAQKNESNFFENNYIKPETQRGFTKGRAKGVKRPLLLSLDVLPKHIDDVTHYIAHFTAIKEVDRFVNDARIQRAIGERFGPEYGKMFRPWLQAIAKDSKETGSPATYIDFMLRRLRYGTTMVAMGFKLSTALLQPAGFFNSIGAELGRPVAGGKFKGRAGVYWLSKGFHSLWNGGFKQAMEQSGELRHRMQTQDRDLRLAMQEMMNSKLWVVPKVGEVAFKHIAYIDMFVSGATWYAAYEKYMAEGDADPAKAIDYADSVVRMSQSSGAIKDLATIQRGPETRRIYTMFYTFFSAFYNQMRSAGRQVKGDPAGSAAAFLFLVTLPIIYDGALKTFLGKELVKDDDEDDTLLRWFLMEHILYPMASVPFLRDVVSGAFGKFGYELSPVAKVGGDIASSIKEIAAQTNEAFGGEEEELSRADIKKMVGSFGVVTGLPTTQFASTLEFMADWMNGNTEPEGPIDVFQGLASGTPREDKP